jgi:CRISPR-associated endoribonuclease Cas6
MRVKLTLFLTKRGSVLPVNYNYFLTSFIYKILKNSSYNYSRFLHEEGYRLEGSCKGFKLFTYSMLMCNRVRIEDEKINFLSE